MNTYIMLCSIVVSLLFVQKGIAGPGRPYFGIAQGKTHKTLLSDKGCLLRGGTQKAIGKSVGSKQVRWVLGNEWAKTYASKGLNFVQIKVLVRYGKEFYKIYPTWDKLAEHLDKIVDSAEKEGIYTIIIFNSVFSQGRDKKKFEGFWNFFAPRYANRKHVIYELINEPQGGFIEGEGWQWGYDLVRKHAPETPVLLFSRPGGLNTKDLNLLNNMKVDKNLTGAAFHTYHGKKNTQRMAKPYLKAGWGVVMTENDWEVGSPENIKEQEDLGISWVSWDGKYKGEWEDFDATMKKYSINTNSCKGVPSNLLSQATPNYDTKHFSFHIVPKIGINTYSSNKRRMLDVCGRNVIE